MMMTDLASPFGADAISLVGNTPLIRLRAASEATGCEVLGKAEFLNPAGSVKDRTAVFLIEDAEAKGLIKPGDTLVEGTAGNTGIGLAMVASAKGYKTLIVMPNTQSREKVDALKAYGAQIELVPPKPYSDPDNYNHIAKRRADEINALPGQTAYWTDQFDNTANRDGHARTTAQELWQQTDGKIDGFICAVGTGGTLGGVSQGLKALNPDVQIGLADPMGAKLFHYYKHGELKSEGSSVTEGIGQGRITSNLEGVVVDHAFQITDAEALPVMFGLAKEEGLWLGGSSGVNVAGAIHLAQELGPGHTVATILCDSGARYQSKLYNEDFLKEKGLPLFH